MNGSTSSRPTAALRNSLLAALIFFAVILHSLALPSCSQCAIPGTSYSPSFYKIICGGGCCFSGAWAGKYCGATCYNASSASTFCCSNTSVCAASNFCCGTTCVESASRCCAGAPFTPNVTWTGTTCCLQSITGYNCYTYALGLNSGGTPTWSTSQQCATKCATVYRNGTYVASSPSTCTNGTCTCQCPDETSVRCITSRGTVGGSCTAASCYSVCPIVKPGACTTKPICNSTQVCGNCPSGDTCLTGSAYSIACPSSG